MLVKKMIIVVLLLVCFLGTGFAQESKKVGIGVALFDLMQLFETVMSDGIGANATIVVPVFMSANFRLEPEIGYFTATQEETNGDTETSTATSWRIGVGIFPQKTYDDFILYYGGRVGYLSQSEKYEEGTYNYEENTSGFFIAPAIGGEHFFSDHFSIGGEAQLVYATLDGDNNQNDDKISLNLFNTRVLAFFRFYF